jgi:3',5'-cyclic AMP phosphodiesterase CpdA
MTKIIHFSDSHAGAFPDNLSAFIDKRIVGTFNYTFRRRFLHNMEYLNKAVEFMLIEEPDVIICTGDITSTGQPAEFEKALEILAPLIDHSGIRLLYTPGNHDSYVKNQRCSKSLNQAFSKLNGNDIHIEDLPVKTRVGDCEFIIVNECRPTNIFLSTGYFPEKSLRKIGQWCNEKTSLPLVLVGHFPLRKHNSLLSFRHRIYDQEKVAELINDGKIDLSLCGHTHKPFQDIDETGRGETGAGSITRTKDLNVIEYDPKSKNFSHSTILMD